MTDTEESPEVLKAVRLPLDLWAKNDQIIRDEDTDFSKWARRSFRRQIARDTHTDYEAENGEAGG